MAHVFDLGDMLFARFVVYLDSDSVKS